MRVLAVTGVPTAVSDEKRERGAEAGAQSVVETLFGRKTGPASPWPATRFAQRARRDENLDAVLGQVLVRAVVEARCAGRGARAAGRHRREEVCARAREKIARREFRCARAHRG